MKSESDIMLLLAGMRPVLIEGEFVYAMVADLRGIEAKDTLCIFQESEGTTLICSRAYADRTGLRYEACFRQITLSVHSSLQAVGFLAAVSGALAQGGIPCNTVSAFVHDHLFVPSAQFLNDAFVLRKILIMRAYIVERGPVDFERFGRILLAGFRNRLRNVFSFRKPSEDLAIILFFTRRAIADDLFCPLKIFLD